jgi:hypothetical protein
MKSVDYAVGAVLVIAAGALRVPGNKLLTQNNMLAGGNFLSGRVNKQTEN